jgi:hypothetical protein
LEGDGQQLLLIDIVNAYGVILLQTVWAVTPDLVAGRRRTDVERIDDQALLLNRLSKLVPLLAGHLPAATAAAA